MPRIVACLVCSKLERMIDVPDDVPRVPATLKYMDMGVEREYTIKDETNGYTIMVPETDPWLEDFVGRHGHGLPDTAVGSIKVFPVTLETWERLDVVTEVKKELADFTGMLFEESSYYKDEALKCFSEHHRPSEGCVDYLDESKRIGSGRMPKKHQAFLCHMCPVAHGYVATEIRKKKKLYEPRK